MTAAELLFETTPYLFMGVVALACGTAALLGGWEGRWIACLYALALIATKVANNLDYSWTTVNGGVALVDTALLVALYVIALRSRRYWPLWLAGLQLVTVTSHLSAWLAPAFFYKTYFALAVFWSLPKMAVLLIGVLIDWRRDHDRRADLATAAERPASGGGRA